MLLRACLVPMLLPAVLAAQPPASARSFGSGCPGSSLGLGAPDVVPQAYAATFGKGNNSLPLASKPIRYQQVFLGSELTGLPVYGAMGLRQDEALPGTEGEWIDFEVALGGTTFDDQTIGNAFDANFDAPSTPKTTVFQRRTFALPMMPATNANASVFFLTIPFDAPWPRTLAAGENLLIDVVVHGNSNNNAQFRYALDSVNGGARTTRIFAVPPAPTGTVLRGSGLVMAFYPPGAPQPLTLQASRPPRLASTFYAELWNAAPSAPGVWIVGLSDTSSSGVPLPFSLGGLGASGCSLLASTDLTLPVMAHAGGDLALGLAVPNNPFLTSVPLFAQLAMADPGNLLGVVTTNGLALSFGN